MRPIAANKGGQPVGYPYNLAFDYKTVSFNFAAGNAPAANNLYGRTNLTYEECFDVWNDVAKVKNAQMVAPAYLPDEKTIATAVKNNIGPIYGQVLLPFTQNLGPFCNYCEKPLGGRAEVEHICPKAQYPFFCLDFENFLLSCPFCNGKSAKGNQPSRSYVVTQWLGNVQPPYETGYYDEILKRYFWPQKWNDCYRDVKAKLQVWRLGAWSDLNLATLAIRAGIGNCRYNYQTKIATADVFLTAFAVATTNSEVQVVLDGTAFAQGTRIVDLCRMNSPNVQKQDYRVGERTLAWFTVLDELAGLAIATTQPNFNILWRNTLRTAVAVGFYSVWVQVFQLTAAQDPNGALLVTRFVNETNVAGMFPNTDTTNIP